VLLTYSESICRNKASRWQTLCGFDGLDFNFWN